MAKASGKQTCFAVTQKKIVESALKALFMSCKLVEAKNLKKAQKHLFNSASDKTGAFQQ